MKRMITKQMRDSFEVSAKNRMNMLLSGWDISKGDSAAEYFESTKKQRILILRRTIK